ncbi:hypothetical protein ABZX40_11445 [Streptomyces sp. NPDC004610]|uniref:hypothetical protein n=1 Tax=unclassified Streptomyces TaxID=2593676 RepID=UPI0033BBEB23
MTGFTTPFGGARIIAVNPTGGHQRSPVISETPHSTSRDDDPSAARAQPKTANAPLGGHHFEGCRETEAVDHRTGTPHGVARYAVDWANARRLRDVPEERLTESRARHEAAR